MLKDLSVITLEEEIACDHFFRLFQTRGNCLTVKTRCPRSTVDKESPVIAFLSAMEKPSPRVPAVRSQVSSRKYFCSQKYTKRSGKRKLRSTGYLPESAFKRLLWRMYYQLVVPLRLRAL